MNKTSESPLPNCGACPVRQPGQRRCMAENGKHPADCPTESRRDLAKAALKKYLEPQNHKFAQEASRVECAGYERLPNASLKPVRPRIVEVVDLCKRMEYRKLGLIFCLGLRKEAAVVTEILQTNGFEVVSAVCKAGAVPKSAIGLADEDHLQPGSFETMCNPIFQAELANDAEVDFNILLGLCVGHDTLTLRYLKAPATILAVKDRVTGHNPLAPIYAYDSYYSYLKKPL